MLTLEKDQLRYWLALWRAPKIGPKQFSILLHHFPILDTLFSEPPSLLKKFNLPLETLIYLSKPDWKQIDKDIAWSEQPNHSIVSWQDTLYPPLLKEISNAPPLLFVEGNAALLSKPQLAIVGSRSPTPVGRDTAEQFAKELSSLGLTITSGLALGIDGAGHKGALAATGETVAVIATGMDTVYPKVHVDLAKKISETGALVTEFPLHVGVQAQNFPRRNRIVSGLSVGTLVVEAGKHSGSLITARLANEQGREVFAIPGSIHNPNARGCHSLIQQGAKLITTTQNIIEELGPLLQFVEEKCLKETLFSHSKEAELLDYIRQGPTPIDDLINRSQLTATEISSILLKLELRGMITAVPGGYLCEKGK